MPSSSSTAGFRCFICVSLFYLICVLRSWVLSPKIRCLRYLFVTDDSMCGFCWRKIKYMSAIRLMILICCMLWIQLPAWVPRRFFARIDIARLYVYCSSVLPLFVRAVNIVFFVVIHVASSLWGGDFVTNSALGRALHTLAPKSGARRPRRRGALRHVPYYRVKYFECLNV